MTRGLGIVALGLIACSWVACGGASTQEPPPKAAGVSPGAGSRADTAPAAIEREPPAHAPLWLRLAAPATGLRELAALGVAKDANVQFMLEHPDRVLQVMLGPALANSLDLDQPVDVLSPISQSTKPDFTAAFFPRDPVALVSGRASIRLDELAPGRWSLEPIDGAPPKLAVVCELWREPAGPKLRIVCGESSAQIAASAAFLVGGAAQSQNTASMRLEMGSAGVQKAIAASKDDARPYADDMEAWGEQAGRQFAEKLMSQIDFWAGELTLSTREVALSTDVAFGRYEPVDVASWLGDERSPPLETFSRLPGDADFALAFSGIQQRTAESLIERFLAAIMPVMNRRYEISESYTQQVRHAMLGVLPPDARFALAVGRDEDEVRALSTHLREQDASAKTPAPDEIARLDEELTGWILVGLETDPKGYVAAIREAYRVATIETPARPPSAQPDGKADEPAAVDPQIVRVAVADGPPKGLPAGSLYWRRSVRPNPKFVPSAEHPSPARNYDVHFVAVPDGSRLWVAVARKLSLAIERARAQLDPSRREARSTPELARPGTAPLLALGRVNLARLFTLDTDSEPAEARPELRARLALSDAAPNRGDVLVPFWLTLESSSSGSPHAFRLQTRLPQPAIEDIVHWLKTRG